jgi:hypothetical protein
VALFLWKAFFFISAWAFGTARIVVYWLHRGSSDRCSAGRALLRNARLA